jgi:hypothetical protein
MENEPEGGASFQAEMSLNKSVLGSSEDDDRETTLPTTPQPAAAPGLSGRLRAPGFQYPRPRRSLWLDRERPAPTRLQAPWQGRQGPGHFGDVRFERLAHICNIHLCNLRRSAGYQRRRRHVDKTRPSQVRIGERRKPFPDGRPGCLRVDTVHQGDLDGIKGLYHVNTVDEVTQIQAIVSVERISERYLLPALAQLLDAFPFVILGLPFTPQPFQGGISSLDELGC